MAPFDFVILYLPGRSTEIWETPGSVQPVCGGPKFFTRFNPEVWLCSFTECRSTCQKEGVQAHWQSNFVEAGTPFLLISLCNHRRHMMCQIVCNFHKHAQTIYSAWEKHDVEKQLQKKNGKNGLYEREVYQQDLILPFLHPCNKKIARGLIFHFEINETLPTLNICWERAVPSIGE